MIDAPPEPVNPLDGLLGYQIRRASSALMALLSAELARHGLRPSVASILVLIAANPRIRQSEIGRVLGIQRANMAPLVATLERRGLIGRERVDGRSHGLVLTVHGERVAAAARAAMAGNDALVTAAITDGDRQRLASVLEALGDRLRALADADASAFAAAVQRATGR